METNTYSFDTGVNYFGKGCRYFGGQWEGLYGGSTYKPQNYLPVLVHCSHEENKDKCEGNCNVVDCPLMEG